MKVFDLTEDQPTKIRQIVISARLPALKSEILTLENEIRVKRQILFKLRLQETDYLIELAAIDRHWGREPRTL